MLRQFFFKRTSTRITLINSNVVKQNFFFLQFQHLKQLSNNLWKIINKNVLFILENLIENKKSKSTHLESWELQGQEFDTMLWLFFAFVFSAWC